MTGCRCITIDPGDALDPGLGGASIIDTTGCPVHPVFCEGMHPTLGVGCEGHPGHGGHCFTLATWPTREQAEREPKPGPGGAS